MATLHECLKQLPPDMLMKDGIRGEIKPVSEWLNQKDEGGFELGEARSNYGKARHAQIYVPGVGAYLYEVKQ